MSTTGRTGRRATIYRVIQEQKTRLKHAGKQLIWEKRGRDDEDDDQRCGADVVIVLSDSNLAESLVQILHDQVPQVQVINKHYPGNAKQFLLITGHDECLKETAGIIGVRQKTYLDLSSQQRQSIVKYYLDSLRMLHGEIKSSISVREGQVVLPRLLDLKHIQSIFPLHTIPEVKKLHKSWVSSFASQQPLDQIEAYFGSSIAMYFAYLGHYTTWLLFPTTIGIFIHIMDEKSPILTICFTITSFVWSALYLESLQGYSRKLSVKWSKKSGTKRGLIPYYSVRPNYDGDVAFDSETGQVIVEENETRRNVQRWIVSYPIIGVSISFLFLVTFYLLKFQTYWDEELIGNRGYPTWTSFLPKVSLALVISFLDGIYYRIAVALNNSENYAFDSIHESHLVGKLIIFQFVSSFLSLFYLTIYVGDISKLRDQLMTLLITRQVLGNIREAIVPLIMPLIKLPSRSGGGVERKLSQPEIESSLDPYKSTFDDYLEMLIQFGHVVLFFPIFPLAATCALINNFIEIRSDAFKLCVAHQRPFAGPRICDIREWFQALNILVYLSIPINCILLVKTGVLESFLHQLFGWKDDGTKVILAGVLLEHLMIALKFSCESDKIVPFFNRKVSFGEEDDEDEHDDDEIEQNEEEKGDTAINEANGEEIEDDGNDSEQPFLSPDSSPVEDFRPKLE